jgi:hypothetical protein
MIIIIIIIITITSFTAFVIRNLKKKMRKIQLFVNTKKFPLK